MRTLFVSTETFTDMLDGFIKSGVTFESEEKNGGILITFTWGLLKKFKKDLDNRNIILIFVSTNTNNYEFRIIFRTS